MGSFGEASEANGRVDVIAQDGFRYRDFAGQRGFQTLAEKFFAKLRIALHAVRNGFLKVAGQGHGCFSYLLRLWSCHLATAALISCCWRFLLPPPGKMTKLSPSLAEINLFLIRWGRQGTGKRGVLGSSTFSIQGHATLSAHGLCEGGSPFARREKGGEGICRADYASLSSATPTEKQMNMFGNDLAKGFR